MNISERLSKYKHEIILIIILLLAASLRLYNYSGWSLSNDELSALNRIRYDNLKDVVKFGVMKYDTHPAGVQIFLYYWTKTFGDSEASVRLPFVIAGILSILFIYLITAKWFNKTAGLFTALALSFLQYPILYSQLARPYSFGLLFSLLTVWFWTMIFFNKTRRKPWMYVGFVFSVTLALYTHYFSSLFVFIVSITGLLFLKKDNWKPYIVSGIAILVLYIPHCKVVMYQYAYGFENVSWLGAPGKDWLIDYISYCFNDSAFLLILMGLIFIGSIIAGYKQLKFSKFFILSFLWFQLPFLIGYYYSVTKTPVLQNSVLLFSFPFLVVFLFSFIPEKLNVKVIILFFVLAASGVFSTSLEKKFYSTQHFGEFKGLAEKIIEWDKKYGYDKITRTINIHAPYYIDYYLNRQHEKVAFVKYNFSEQEDLVELISIVNQRTTPYFLYAYSNVENTLEIYEIIREKYPRIREQKKYFGSSVILFEKDSTCKRTSLFSTFNDFERHCNYWESNKSLFDSSVFLSGGKSYKIDSVTMYSATFAIKNSELKPADSCLVSISVNGFLTKNATAELVLSVEKKGREKENEWYSSALHKYIKEHGKWGKVYLTKYLKGDLSPEDIIKVYVWNTGKNNVYIDDFKIDFYNP
ncbi:MAG: glycosyltransferase family 39 protein [Bacteroidia bacterium]|nr:glycosyltransferase family 39 protein [Bacteroidia bacterium]